MVRPGQLSPQQEAAISLPASLFERILDQDIDDIGIFFALYNTSDLFPVNSDGQNPTEVGSRVLAATVGPGLNFQNLQENVTILLRIITNKVNLVVKLIIIIFKIDSFKLMIM